MNRTAGLISALGALNAALAVVAGAYGAHALKSHVAAADAATFHTAVQYHLFHALGLLFVGAAAAWRPNSRLLITAAVVMFAGIVLFCGGLYASAAGGYTALRVLAPFGGTAFIVSWLIVAVALLKKP